MVRIRYILHTMHRPSAPRPVESTEAAANAARGERAQGVQTIRSETLFRGEAELQIQHRGSLYRLRQTSLGKLILTK